MATKAPSESISPEAAALAAQIDTIAVRSAALAETAGKQIDRIKAISRLKSERTSVREGVDNESITFGDGSARLAAIAAELELHEFQRGKRGTDINTEFHSIRSEVTSAKWALINAIDRAVAGTIQARQTELLSLMTKWGGTKPATEAPAFVSNIAEACPTVSALEASRDSLHRWRPDHGLAAFQATAKPILELLGKLSIPEAVGPLFGGFQERQRIVLAGWRDHEARFEPIEEFTDIGTANNRFAEIKAQAGHLGYTKVIVFHPAAPHNEANFKGGDAFGVDCNQNREAGLAAKGQECPDFLATASRWLGAA